MRTAPSRRWAAATYVTACAAFAGALGVLAAQVQAGDDPVIGAKQAAPAPRPKIVVTRKIVRTTVVTTRVIPRPRPVAVAAAAAGSAAPAQAAAPAGSAAPAAAAPAPVASAPAPVASAPVPAPAPAPAPAAPVTRAS